MSDFHVVGDPRYAPDAPGGGGGVSKEYVDNADTEVKKTAAKGHNNKYHESVLPSIVRNKLYVYGNPELMYKASETGGDEPIYAIGGSEVSYNWWGQEAETFNKADFKIYGEDTDSGNNYNRLAVVKCVNPENPASSWYVLICPDYKYTITANPQNANAAISVINSLSHEYGATPKTRLWLQSYSGDPLAPQGYDDIDYGIQLTGGEIYDESTYNKYYNCRISGIPLFSVVSNTQEAFAAVNTYIRTGDASGAINYADINPGSKDSYCAIDVISGDWYTVVNNAWVKQGTLDLNETGGTEVEANPQGTSTDTLNTISIDGTIYDLPSGSTLPFEFVIDENDNGINIVYDDSILNGGE
jgi:hypothetical protein